MVTAVDWSFGLRALADYIGDAGKLHRSFAALRMTVLYCLQNRLLGDEVGEGGYFAEVDAESAFGVVVREGDL